MVRTLDLTKRDAILKAAKSILLKDGYAAAKMCDIAAEAGVAPGTLYLYFENKEALASAIGEHLYSRVINQFVSIIKKTNGPDLTVALVDKALQIASDEALILVMVREGKKDKRFKKEERGRFVVQLAEALSQLISDDVIRRYEDANMLADLLLAFMRRLIMSRAIFADQDISRLRTSAIVMLQHLLFEDLTLTAYDLIKQKRRNK